LGSKRRRSSSPPIGYRGVRDASSTPSPLSIGEENTSGNSIAGNPIPAEQLKKVRGFEKRNKDRETLVGQIDRKIRANNNS
jgi:hypothetical protein